MRLCTLTTHTDHTHHDYTVLGVPPSTMRKMITIDKSSRLFGNQNGKQRNDIKQNVEQQQQVWGVELAMEQVEEGDSWQLANHFQEHQVHRRTQE